MLAVCKVVSVSALLEQQSVEGAMIRKLDPLTSDHIFLSYYPTSLVFDDLYFFLVNCF